MHLFHVNCTAELPLITETSPSTLSRVEFHISVVRDEDSIKIRQLKAKSLVSAVRDKHFTRKGNI